MAKDWITLREARELVTGFVLAPELAERLILEQLQKGAMRWRCWRAEGKNNWDYPEPNNPDFWRQYSEHRHGHSVQRIQLLWVNWAESSAKHYSGLSLFRIEAFRADVLALLPEGIVLKQQQAAPEPEPEPEPPLVSKIRAAFPAGVGRGQTKEVMNLVGWEKSEGHLRRLLRDNGLRPKK